jgi:hypothetical protein
VAGEADSVVAGEADSSNPPRRKRRGRWVDRTVGVTLGLVLGIGVIAVFVFKGSEGTIDAPRISGVEGAQPGGGAPTRQIRVPLVRVIAGKPPASGPARLDFKTGRRARFVVQSDQELGLEVVGYGVSRTVSPGRTLVSFKTTKSGQFPIVDSASEIAIANLRVAAP